jgi:hypothetical protein
MSTGYFCSLYWKEPPNPFNSGCFQIFLENFWSESWWSCLWPCCTTFATLLHLLKTLNSWYQVDSVNSQQVSIAPYNCLHYCASCLCWSTSALQNTMGLCRDTLNWTDALKWFFGPFVWCLNCGKIDRQQLQICAYNDACMSEKIQMCRISLSDCCLSLNLLCLMIEKMHRTPA